MSSFTPAVVLICLLNSCRAFYLPGLAPVNYCPTATEDANCPVRTADTSLFSYIYMGLPTGSHQIGLVIGFRA